MTLRKRRRKKGTKDQGIKNTQHVVRFMYILLYTYTRFSESVENESRLAQDGTAEPVSWDHNLRGEMGTGKDIISLVQLTTSRIGNLTWSTTDIMDKHTCNIHTYIHTPTYSG